MDRSTDRLVYYSVAVSPGPAAEEVGRQLVASVRSLRRYNARVAVRVLSFGALPAAVEQALAELGADVRREASYAEHLASFCEPHMLEALRLLPLLQKWTGLSLLREEALSSVLYLDTDTVFLGDVERLFDRYGALDLYAREEPFSRASHLGYHPESLDQDALDRAAMREDCRAPAPFNCGVVLMNHGSFRRIAAVAPEVVRFTYRIALGLARLPPAPEHGRDVEVLRERLRAGGPGADLAGAIEPLTANGWLKEQIGLWLALGKLPGLRVGTIARSDSLQGREYEMFDPEALGATLVHYFSSNAAHVRAERPAWFSGARRAEVRGASPEAFFEAMGDRIESAYRETGYDEERFPEIAERALRCLSKGGIEETAVLTWLLRAAAIPRQANIGYDFGQPAVVVYGTPRWYIEVIHWLDGTTNIHQHGFCGAFSVLAGSSLHATYDFHPTRRYNARLASGVLRKTGAELLRKGDVRRIESGSALIHSLFHLDHPSVSVVVRTDHTPGDSPQYTYEPPGLAFDPFHEPELLARKRQALRALAAVAPAELARELPFALGEADPFSLVSLALAAAPLVPESVLGSALEAARPRSGALVDLVLLVAVERRRRERLIALRSKLCAADHRFFLALLLSSATCAEMSAIARARHPDREPHELLVQWLSEVTSTPDPEDPSRSVLGAPIDGAMLDLARAMLGGASFEEVIRALGRTYGEEDLSEQAGDLRAAYDALRGAPLFAPLFRGGAAS